LICTSIINFVETPCVCCCYCANNIMSSKSSLHSEWYIWWSTSISITSFCSRWSISRPCFRTLYSSSCSSAELPFPVPRREYATTSHRTSHGYSTQRSVEVIQGCVKVIKGNMTQLEVIKNVFNVHSVLFNRRSLLCYEIKYTRSL